MRSRSFLATALALFVLLAGAGVVLAYDHSQRDEIAKGIRIGGIDVGGLSTSRAEAKLRALYRARVAHPLALRYHSHRFTLSADAAHLVVDVPASVKQAIARSRADNLFTRVYRSLTGGSINDDLLPQVSFSHGAVTQLVATVSRTLDRPPRDASIAYSGSSISPVQSQTGRSVKAASLTAEIDQALGAGSTGNRLRIPVVRVEPKVTSSELAARYPTIITVNRSAFQLRLWRRLHLVKSYTIAVGQQGLATPAGLYHIQDKQVDPSWHVPNSSWAGALAGQTIPPGPQDPLKARWLGIYNGAGIHGTDALGSLGTAASHGCIRMAIPDVIELYGQTPLGSPVYIA